MFNYKWKPNTTGKPCDRRIGKKEFLKNLTGVKTKRKKLTIGFWQ